MVTRKLRNIPLRKIPKVKLKRLGRAFARDVRKAGRTGKKIARERIGGIKPIKRRRRR